jgi:hypothetical protein
MNILLDEHKNFLLLLLKHKVDFILIGGYAVIFHGYERTTADMDLWLKPDNLNKELFIGALEEHGIDDESLATVRHFDFEKAQVFFIGKKPQKIDFLTKVRGLTYSEAEKEKIFFPLKDKQVPILQYDHLITLKMLAGRPQDKADIDELQRIAKFRKSK